jgi:hypothetical protein
MWVSRESYHSLSDFVAGCDAATGGALLDGFKEWICIRDSRDPRSSIAWVGQIVVSTLCRPRAADQDYYGLSDKDDEMLRTALAKYLDEFLSEQDRRFSVTAEIVGGSSAT